MQKRYSFRTEIPLDVVVGDVVAMLQNWTTHPSHPCHFGLFVPGSQPAGVLADALVALYNPVPAAWCYAPGACEIERFVIRYFLRKVGFVKSESGGHFTSGGSEATATAVVAALERRFPEARANGIVGSPRIYVSEHAHDSIFKIAQTTGLGRCAIQPVPVNTQSQMDVPQLASLVDHDRQIGKVPFLVVGTAGTTAVGAIDPLCELAAFCAENGLWFHVDAAWGGAALLSRQRKVHLRGIEYADSVTWDAHKTLPVPMGAGMYLCRDATATHSAFGVTTGYVPAQRQGIPDLYRSSMQWSRRFTGLKVFMTLAVLGDRGLASLIDHQASMGNILRKRLADHGWAILNDTPLPVVCFTHKLFRTSEEIRAAVQRIVSRGRVWLSEVQINNTQSAFRACITNHETTDQDLDVLLDELEMELFALE